MTASDDILASLRPETRALVVASMTKAASQHTPEFTRTMESLFFIQVCTSLSDEDATTRANELPSGTSHGWQLVTGDPNCAPVPCADRPETHRHLIFEC